MDITYYHIDTFSTKPFLGNPAIVCILSEWLNDKVLQEIANEFNSMITTFLILNSETNRIRFFTVTREVALCGHGAIAAGFVIKHGNETLQTNDYITFSANDNQLLTVDLKDRISIDLPLAELNEYRTPSNIIDMIGSMSEAMFKSHDRYYAILKTEDDVVKSNPNFDLIRELGLHGLVISAPSKEYDFVSRTFGPNIGVNEDYVTGTSHAGLAPYWAKILDKQLLNARQLSSRPGDLQCRVADFGKVTITADCFLFAKGTLTLQI